MKFALILILLFSAELSRARIQELDSSAGGWSGNGGGLHQVNDNVWYLGSDPIRYCLRNSDDFPVTRDNLRAMVSRSFNAWQQFFTKYNIGRPQGLPVFLQPLQPQMTLTGREVNCSDKPELEFLFGVDNKTLSLYRELNENDGYGLALRSAYSHQQHRHQGYVWIPAFNQDPRKIEHMLIHELGHVFGMKHDTVFVMDRDIALMLKSMAATDPAIAFLTKIEADFWPFDLNAGTLVKLEPYARRLPGSQQKAPIFSCNDGSISVTEIPVEFHPNLPMPTPPCVRITLQKNKDPQENNFQLNIDSEAGYWLSTVYGTFQALQPGNEQSMVPGTLSTWLNAKLSLSRWFYLPYAKHNMHAQLSGYFIRGQTRYPAKISWSRGLTLEIFIPAQARWWSIRSFSQ